MKKIAIAVLLVAVGAGGAFMYLRYTRSLKETPVAVQAKEFCTRHQIAEKDCPWCDPSLVNSKGKCPEHGVPEALCAQCNPALIAGFKVENDWCAGHGVPESQCAPCLAGGHLPGEKKGALPKDSRR